MTSNTPVLTKDYILDHSSLPLEEYDKVKEYMDEWAQQISIAFAEWIRCGHGDMRVIYSYNGDGTWDILTPTKEPAQNKKVTTEQLYQTFLKTL